MLSLSENSYEENKLMQSIKVFLKRFKVQQALTRSNACKLRGIPLISIIAFLLQLVFTKTSMYMNLVNDTNDPGFKKDVVYRILNSIYINWQRFLLFIAVVVINDISKLTSDDRVNAIVIDDSFYGRQRSKDVELLSNVFDHTSNATKFKKGFRLLTAGWTDGNTFIPLTYSLLSSENQKNRYNEINASVDKRSTGYKRRKQAITKSPSVVLELLDDIIASGISTKHVLFDAWFSHPKTIVSVNKKQLHPIARVKNTPKIKYLLNGDKKTLSEIYRTSRKRRGKSKYLLSVDVSVCSSEDTIHAKIVYVRDRNNSKKWIAIITTDVSLHEEEIIRIYGKRWNIEVFFKVCKSYLRLSKEFQCLSYDSMFAHTAIVFLRYIMLAVETRENEDKRSLGELFFFFYEELKDINFSEALSLLLDILSQTLYEVLFLTEEQVESFIEVFISKLPQIFMGRLEKIPLKN